MAVSFWLWCLPVSKWVFRQKRYMKGLDLWAGLPKYMSLSPTTPAPTPGIRAQDHSRGGPIQGHFLFVRTDRPVHSHRNENFILIKTIQPDQPNPTVKIVCTKKMVFSCGFSANTLWKKPISFANWLVQQWSSRPFLTNGKRPQCQNSPQLQNFFRKTALDTGYSVLEWTREKFITAGWGLTFGARCERVWSRKKSGLLRQ